MTRKLPLLLACLALVASFGCSQPHQDGPSSDTAQTADAAGGEEYQKAVEAVQAAYMEAETFDEKLALLKDFLDRYPEAEDLADALEVAVNDAMAADKPEAAYELIALSLERTEDPEKRFEARMKLAALHGKTGKKEELRALAAELGEERELRYRDHYAIVEAALEAEDWELALEHSEASLAFATPAAFHEDSPDLSEQEAERYGTRRVAYSLAFKGWAQYNLGRVEEALASFETAEASTDYNPLGVDATPLHRYWGRALAREGRAEEAMEKLAAEALFGREDAALEAYRTAYAARHGGEDGFEEHLWSERLANAVEIPDFALPDYQGETLRLSDLAGEVVLLTFWFPT